MGEASILESVEEPKADQLRSVEGSSSLEVMSYFQNQMKPLIVLLLSISCREAAPPIHIDFRPALFYRVEHAVAKIEGFGHSRTIATRQHNPGCLRLRSGRFARYSTDQAGWNALHAWFVRRQHMRLAAALRLYNSEEPKYAERVLREAGLPADLRIGDFQ